jgi:acyl-CoA synthetase (AMP-forming)/AMP-acid ligase II
MYDHARLAAISRNMGDLTHEADRRLVSLPFAHVGYMTRIWDELAHGTTLVVTGEPWSAAETLRLLGQERITVGTGVPTQWQMVLAHPDLAGTDTSHLRLCGIGGAAVAPDLVRRMREVLGCPVMNRYTSTEAGITTGTGIGDPDDVVAETVGRPAPAVELRLLDPDGTEVEPGEVGEIVVRSPMVMLGYWRDPTLTATVLDGEGWLHTGDLARADTRGDLRIVGRLKEMYIRGGYNVYPAEVEHVLTDHPGVDRVAVIGRPAPTIGEEGVAFVVPADPADPPDLEGLRSWCRDRIADYKAPDRLVLVESLPVTSMLKVDKRALAARMNEEP